MTANAQKPCSTTIDTAKKTPGRRLFVAALLALASVSVAAGCASGDGSSPQGATSSSSGAPPSSSATPAQATVKANPAGSGETATATIDNETGGTVALSDGTTIEVPAGALPPGVDTITVTSSPEPAPAEYEAVAPVFQFGPDGTVFAKPLKVTIPITAPADTDTSTLTVLWSRPSNAPGFDMVPTTFAPSSTGFVATSEVTHFSKGFCGKKYSVDPHPSADPYQK